MSSLIKHLLFSAFVSCVAALFMVWMVREDDGHDLEHDLAFFVFMAIVYFIITLVPIIKNEISFRRRRK